MRILEEDYISTAREDLFVTTTKIINSLFFQSESFITEQIVREFLKKVRLGVDDYLLTFKTILELNKELDDKLLIYKKKKRTYLLN